MGNRKYELTNITMEFAGRTLYRIRALKDFSDVKAGELGGWVSNEYNLSQYGNCWIYDNAKAMDRSRMYGDSAMYDYSKMYNYSAMYDSSEMYGNSAMHNNSEMHDNSKMFNNSKKYDDSIMFGNSVMLDYSSMYGDSAMYGDSMLKDEEKLYGQLISKVDKFIDISNPKGEIVTGVLKDGEVLFNVGNLSEINKEEFLDILYNGNEITEESSSRKEYLKIINIIILYLLG